MRTRLSPAVLVVSCALLFTGHAYAGYKYSVLPSYSGGPQDGFDPYSRAAGINNAGQVVGTSLDDAQFPRATIWTSGKPDVQRPGDWYNNGSAINDKGQIAGFYADTYGRFPTGYAFASPYSDASLGRLGVSGTNATDINNNGLVVGFASTDLWAGPPTYPFPFYGSHAVVWNGSSTIDLNPAGAAGSAAYAVNDANVIVGQADGRAVQWTGGVATPLGTDIAVAYDINNAGTIVGKSGSNAVMWNGGTQTVLGAGQANALNILAQVVGISNGHAFLWANGIATDLNDFISAADKSAGWIMQEAVGINDRGWIVGNAFNSVTLTTQAFLLTPVPEPSTWAMLLAGLGLIGWKARKTRRDSPMPAAA